VLVNPMIVDGQVIGGVAQGIGTALYEEMPFDYAGQPLATTLADYTLPGATEVPALRIDHMETPSPYTSFGQKGIGEGGAIGPPEGLLLTGTHLGCEHGVCGACTILLDGEPARACITYAADCAGREVCSIEGFEHDEVTAALRQAFSADCCGGRWRNSAVAR